MNQNATNPFAIGQSVRLKSGGLPMTVNKVFQGHGTSPHSYDCVWMTGAKMNTHNLEHDAIEKFESDGK